MNLPAPSGRPLPPPTAVPPAAPAAPAAASPIPPPPPAPSTLPPRSEQHVTRASSGRNIRLGLYGATVITSIAVTVSLLLRRNAFREATQGNRSLSDVRRLDDIATVLMGVHTGVAIAAGLAWIWWFVQRRRRKAPAAVGLAVIGGGWLIIELTWRWFTQIPSDLSPGQVGRRLTVHTLLAAAATLTASIGTFAVARSRTHSAE